MKVDELCGLEWLTCVAFGRQGYRQDDFLGSFHPYHDENGSGCAAPHARDLAKGASTTRTSSPPHAQDSRRGAKENKLLERSLIKY